MIANSPATGIELLIFFHRMLSTEDLPPNGNLDFFAADFGVKKQGGTCHLVHFDAIAEILESVIRATRQNSDVLCPSVPESQDLTRFYNVALIEQS